MTPPHRICSVNSANNLDGSNHRTVIVNWVRARVIPQGIGRKLQAQKTVILIGTHAVRSTLKK